MSLYTKTLLFVAALLGTSLVTRIYYSKKIVSQVVSGQIADFAASAAAESGPDFQKAIASGNELDGIKALHVFGVKTKALYSGLMNMDGKTIAHTDVTMVGTQEDLKDLKHAQVGAPYFYRRNYKGEEILEVLIAFNVTREFSSEEVLFGGGQEKNKICGFLRTGLSLVPVRKAERTLAANIMLVTGAIMLCCIVFSILFLRVIMGQVVFLREGIRKVRSGDYNFLVPVVSKDEFGEVAESFNKLISGLSETTVSKQYLDSILENMPDPLIITGETGLIIKANKAAGEFSGYDLASAPRNLKELLEPQVEGGPEPYSLLEWNGSIKELDMWFLSADGRRLPVMLSAALISAGSGRQVVAVLKDTSQHKKTEARLAQYVKEVETVNSELDAFAHTVSHDLKEPLRGIEMFSGILLSDHAGALAPQAADYLGRVVKASGRMRRLIDDLLSYARIARVRNPYEETDTAALAADAAAGLASFIEEKKAAVHIKDGLPVVFCDAVKLRQVFYNLISNAIKYNDSPRPEVEISAVKFGDYYWEFSVKDNGIGVPPQYAEEVFKIFKRLHSRQEYGGGTGAGLAIVKKIVEQHGGKIWVKTGLNTGADFCFLVSADLKNRPQGE